MPANKTLRIHVHRNGGGHKAGTFEGPPPKMRLDVNDTVTWDLQVSPADLAATFELRFGGFSWPFAGAPAVIAGTAAVSAPNPPAAVINRGLFHYAVKVTTVNGDYVIQDCPELEIL